VSQRSIEVKVGALILVALGLLGAFVVVMGGLSFEPTLTVYVTFQNPGGLQAGAPVRISGVKVGRVSELEFRGGQVNPKTKEPEPPIRAVARIERRYQSSSPAKACSAKCSSPSSQALPIALPWPTTPRCKASARPGSICC
jgi:phospholipid/cholesterol/gamma-HCH transport system substrate-binding protein